VVAGSVQGTVVHALFAEAATAYYPAADLTELLIFILSASVDPSMHIMVVNFICFGYFVINL
jgi:hypothetical protein